MFENKQVAHTSKHILNKYLKAELSPTFSELIWRNLPLDEKKRTIKRWIGRGIYLVFTFAWMILLSTLSPGSEVANLIYLIPTNSQIFINNSQTLIRLIQYCFTPIIMAIFFYLLPIFFRFLAKKQGYTTQNELNHSVLTKLYIFFVISNLLLFSLISILIDIYGQLRAGNLPNAEIISEHVTQIAKNIADVSTFWINFVCLKSLTLTMDLAMLVPLITFVVKKFLMRLTTHELQEIVRQHQFNFLHNYNLLLFFFTIALVYSAMSPMILPFALVYFSVAEIVHKYQLMYIYFTKIESGGKIWPVLFQTVMASVVFFQLTMIIVLRSKGGFVQMYCLIPLPIFTLVYQYAYYKEMSVRCLHLTDTGFVSTSTNGKNLAKKKTRVFSFLSSKTSCGSLPQTKDVTNEGSSLLQSQFKDHAYHELSVPKVPEDSKPSMEKLPTANRQQQLDETNQCSGSKSMHNIDLEKGDAYLNMLSESAIGKATSEADSNSCVKEEDRDSVVSDSSILFKKYLTYSY
jgi:hypothetical protein